MTGLVPSAPSDHLPTGRLLSYYGDDFTGSTDVLEAMTAAGIPSVLLLEPPVSDTLLRFAGARCIGVAGASRARDTAWMDRHLPAILASLDALGAPILQYKVCSTFDSSPTIGSIGRAIDLGAYASRAGWIPMVVGAPRLKRYQAFGHLFAAVEGVGYRIDRHPTMARHPVTPMREADLRLHLAGQTGRRSELIDFVQLRSGQAAKRLDAVAGSDAPIVSIDVLDEETLLEAGRLIWERRGAGLYSASSSGLNYALLAYWRSRGWIPSRPALPAAQAVDVVAAVSGSCSPVTAGQIRTARQRGFVTERLDLPKVLDARTMNAEIERVVELAGSAVRRGASPIVFSAEGPDDPAVQTFDVIARAAGLSREAAGRKVGEALSAVMKRLLQRTPVRRVGVAGGDSSGEVAGALGIDALEVLAAMAPGSPLCRAHCADPKRPPLEIVLKGGQMGDAEFFSALRAGRPAISAA